ncbi:MAG: zinc ribbon domain-containing protein [Candidatus Neomarinimicrobiota bacterium]
MSRPSAYSNSRIGVLPALVLVSTLVLGIRAQETSAYQRFDIYILPEYDHPGVGVIVAGELQPDAYPRYLEMKVPDATTMALLRQPGQDTPANIEIQTRDGNSYLPVDITDSEFQIQFYFNPFTDTAAGRTFRYEISTNELLPEFHVEVYKPLAASKFQHSLENAEEHQDELGLTFYRQHINGLTPAADLSVSISYDNPAGMLTMPALQARLEEMRGQESSLSAAAKPGNLSRMLIVLAVLGVGLFAVLGLFRARKPALAVSPSPASQKRRQTGDVLARPDIGKFCPQCGTLRRQDSRFCANCGKEF